jgi:hypothetical protein
MLQIMGDHIEKKGSSVVEIVRFWYSYNTNLKLKVMKNVVETNNCSTAQKFGEVNWGIKNKILKAKFVLEKQSASWELTRRKTLEVASLLKILTDPGWTKHHDSL